MLRMALNVNQYRDRVSNAELYGDLPRVSFKVKQNRLRLPGHAICHPELPLSMGTEAEGALDLHL